MSDPAKAVFLSYASQDAEAARRIAEALRAAGVEVWFDVEGGLETGDEWDAKIRKQIKECVLFLPVISANTQAREEGYFRIEWELAAQRALGIASGVPFILPLVIDDTREPDALVPDRFRSVQWTRARRGELSPDAIAKLARLWSHRAGLAKHRPPGESTAPAAAGAGPSSPENAPPRRAGLSWLAVAGVAIALGVLAVFFVRRPAQLPAGPTPPAGSAAVVPAARDWPKNPELKRAYQLTLELNSIREDLMLAEEIAMKAAEQAPSDPEAVTVLAHVQSSILVRNFDFTADRTALSRRYCERAVQLSPDDPVALVALAMFLTQRGGDYPRAEALLRRAVTLAPAEPRYARYLARVTGLQNGAEGIAASLRQYQAIAARFPQDPLAHYDLSIRYRDNGDFAAAERSLDAAIALAPVANAIDWKARFALMRGDLPATRQWLDRVPPRMQSEERSVLTRVTYALFSGDTAYGLQALNRYAETWFYDVSNYSGPRSLLLAALREREGRPELARVHYEAALTEIRRYREARPADPGNQGVEAWVLFGLGRVDEARALHRVSVAGAPRPLRHFAPGLWWFWLLPRTLLLDDRAQALAALREVATETAVREPLLRRIQMDPRLAAFHQDPEVLAILSPPKQALAPAKLTDEQAVARQHTPAKADETTRWLPVVSDDALEVAAEWLRPAGLNATSAEMPPEA